MTPVPRDAVCMLGMHRSGTSALAGVLNRLGVDLGGQPMRTGYDNIRGFWEHVELVGVHQQLLAAMGSDWDDPRPLPEDWWRASTVLPFRQQIAEIVRRDFANSPLWGIKDPRLCRLWPLWQTVLDELGIASRFVIIVRHPQEVEGSLFARNGFPQWRSRLLYLQHLLAAEKQTVGRPRVFITYAQLLRDWRATIERIADALALPALRDAIPVGSGPIEQFLTADLRHHRADDDAPARDSGLAEWAGDLYRAIRLADRDPAAIERRCEEVRSAFGAAQALFVPWIEQLRSTLNERAQQLAQSPVVAAEIAGLRNQVQKQVGNLQEQRAEDQRLKTDLANREAAILRRVETFAALSRKFARLRNELKQREEQIQQLSATGKQTQLESEELRHSLTERQAEIGHLRQLLAQQEVRWAKEQYSVWNPVRRRVGRSLRQFGPTLPTPARKRLERFVRENLDQPLSGLPAGASATQPIAERDELRQRSSELLVQALGAAQGKYDVFVFPIIDWEFRIQRPQQFARQLAALGHRVVYFRVTFARWPMERGYLLLKSPVPNVFLCQLACPAPHGRIYADPMRPEQQQALVEAVSNLRNDIQSEQLVSIVNLPFWRPLAEALPGHSIVYDCMDHHAGFSTGCSEMVEEEKRLLQSADLVVTSSARLFDKVADPVPRVLIRNGAEVSFFASRPNRLQARSKRPVVGYYGAIADWFDMEMVIAAARAYPDWDFVLVGSSAGCDVNTARKCGNVRFVGEVPYADLPSYLHAFDVCVIPFKVNDLTLHTNPVKIYEYLSAGKPVVATRLPELELIEEQLHLVDSKEEFVAALKTAMEETKIKKLQERRAHWARQHDWSTRARQLETSVSGLFPKASVILLTHNNCSFTQACLFGLEKFTQRPNWELIIVDNASTDGSVEYLKSYAARCPHVKLILNKENIGFAAGNNAGLKAATGDYLVLLNNDTFSTVGWLGDLIRHMIKDPTIGLIGPVTNNIGNEARVEINYKDMTEMAVAARRYTSAHARQTIAARVAAFFCVAMPRAVYEQVGPLDESFGLGFFEDDDYCRRVRQAGCRVVIAEDVFIHHHLSASFQQLGQEQKSELFKRNLALYEAKWGKWTPHRYRRSDDATVTLPAGSSNP